LPFAVHRLRSTEVEYLTAEWKTMTSDTSFSDDGPPTEEIYLELRQLESAAPDLAAGAQVTEPTPVLAEDDPSGIKARIARLRALLTDRGIEPPS
jgi:hypothetical protein